MKLNTTVARTGASLLLAAAAVTGAAGAAFAAPAAQTTAVTAAPSKATPPDCKVLKSIFDVLATSNDPAKVKPQLDRWIGLLDAAAKDVPADHQAEYKKYVAHIKDIRKGLDAKDPSKAMKEIHDIAVPLDKQLGDCEK
ncbi:hypothetical protein AB0I49_25195 [Streptomyces sp. NPDC050617]|uniref:hypothetical protein n=1 Tax=Streptomyces sp. NPDC050617 TaxID=3154628 RepID=UPI0034421CBA